MSNKVQKSKRAFRKSRRWKDFRRKMYLLSGKTDIITGQRLRKGWQVHHRNLDEDKYEVLNDDFLCCNNLTHKVIHWLWNIYKKDPGVIDRLRREMEIMEAVNKGILYDNLR